MKRIMLVLMPLLLVSCNAYFPHLRVVRANYNVSRGEYQPAIVDYLRAQGISEYEPWLAYNLGTVYHYLGESGAAVDRWEAAWESNVDDLMYGARFNRGVFLFEQGRYQESFQEFRSALRINPGSRAAKTNLELTIERIAAGSELEGEGARSSTGRDDRSDESQDSGGQRMLDYLRRKQEQQWRANQEQAVTEEANDW
ncbi:MAG TPA: tetratricopeptide repeat protein [Alkalispirochaeta sp.]|nr:tetratricopeptide repeat protein [Alkalispirochaeta sp.]